LTTGSTILDTAPNPLEDLKQIKQYVNNALSPIYR
jgi:hypothetical protein